MFFCVLIMCASKDKNRLHAREVIRFILYLSIHLPNTRSTFQSQRVFFIEDAAVSARFFALTVWCHVDGPGHNNGLFRHHQATWDFSSSLPPTV
jgi:hypothetical protein